MSKPRIRCPRWTIQLPNPVHQKVMGLAERHSNSVNQFTASAVSEKMPSVMPLDYLNAEAAKGQRRDFDRFMGLVLDVAAVSGSEVHQRRQR